MVTMGEPAHVPAGQGKLFADTRTIPAAPTAQYIQKVLDAAPKYGVEILAGPG